MSRLLPPDALQGVSLGISVSDSPDLVRLGLTETHFRMALGELARCVLTSKGHLAYGGHLRSDGYTAFLVRELERYGRHDRPLHVCLAWSEHRKLALSAIDSAKQDLGLRGDIVCLDPAGREIDPKADRGETAQPDEPSARQSLTALRRYMTGRTQGRMLIGGKRNGFQGDMPGVVEEAILAVEAGQPIYLAAGFGGATWDIAKALGLTDESSLPTLPTAPAQDQRMSDALVQLARAADRTLRKSLENGLSADENRRLAATYRPSEIATFVSLGLARRFAPP